MLKNCFSVCCLFLIVYLDHNNSYILIIRIVGYFGDMPVFREEEEELVRGGIVKLSL